MKLFIYLSVFCNLFTSGFSQLIRKGIVSDEPSFKYDRGQSPNPESGFIENKGQIVDQNYTPNTKIKYLLVTPGLNLLLRQTGFSYDTYSEKTEQKTGPRIEEKKRSPKRNVLDEVIRQYHRVDINFLNCSPNAQLVPSGMLDGSLNFFTAGTPASGIQGVHKFQRVKYVNIYPNIDLDFFVSEKTDVSNKSQSGLEYQFILHKGANIRDIQLFYSGANATKLKDGKINVEVASGSFSEKIPASYTQNGLRKVEVKYLEMKSDLFSFSLPKDYSIEDDLIIDPTPCLNWGTYFGNSSDNSQAIAVDRSSNVYIAGSTSSTSQIATSGAYQTTVGANGNAYIAKLNSTGSSLLWGTYYGGVGTEAANAIALDSSNNVYITGWTESSTKIATTGAYQTILMSSMDAFVAKFSADGRNLLWGTYYGGTSSEYSQAIAIDTSQNVYISGYTGSTSLIATHGAMDTTFTASGYMTFVAKFNPSGSKLIWGTYYGGNNSNQCYGLALDARRNVYITGYSSSTTGIATPGAYQTVCQGSVNGYENAFIAKINPSGTSLLWGTYYGGQLGAWSFGIALDKKCNAYITGATESSDLIATSGAYDTTYTGNGGARIAFVAKFDSIGSHRLWGTYYGGQNIVFPECIALDATDNVYIAGYTQSASGIATSGAYKTVYTGVNGNPNAFAAKFNPSGSALLWGTYYGGQGYPTGSGGDIATAIALDPNDNVYLTGGTCSSSGIATIGAFKTTYIAGNNGNAFVAMFGCSNIVTGSSETNSLDDENITINPNPFSDRILIDLGNVPQGTAALYNIMGQFLGSWTLSQGINAINLAPLPSGPYFLRVNILGKMHIGKLYRISSL